MPESLILGGICPVCSAELDINERCRRGCLDYLDCEPDVFVPKGRDHRGWKRAG